MVSSCISVFYADISRWVLPSQPWTEIHNPKPTYHKYIKSTLAIQYFLSFLCTQIWAPPTPPQDENDVYIDHNLGLLYDSSVMMESELPPVYIKKEPKKIKVDHGK